MAIRTGGTIPRQIKAGNEQRPKGTTSFTPQGSCPLLRGPELLAPFPRGLCIEDGSRRRTGQGCKSQCVLEPDYFSRMPDRSPPGSLPVGAEGKCGNNRPE